MLETISLRQLKLLRLDRHTWNHLTVRKQMNSGGFKLNVTNKRFVFKSNMFNIYIYKQDLALNNQKGLISRKTQPTKQTNKHFSFVAETFCFHKIFLIQAILDYLTDSYAIQKILWDNPMSKKNLWNDLVIYLHKTNTRYSNRSIIKEYFLQAAGKT